MPVYEYKCDKGHQFEVLQRMTDDPVTKCEVCGAPVQRVFHPVAVHFKGSGFYNTDYGKKKTGPRTSESSSGEGGSSSSSGDSGSSSDSKSSSSGDKASSSSSDSKSSSSSSSSSGSSE
jgi:putative FmdB family regulatory protein